MPLVTFTSAVVLLLLSLTGLHAEHTGLMVIEVRDDRLMLKVQDVPLAVVLKRLAQVSGVAIHSKEPLEEQVNLDLAEVSLDDGIQRLLQHRNTLVMYGSHAKRPSAVYIFGPRRGSLAGTGLSLTTSQSAGDGETNTEADHLKTALLVQDLDEKLSALSAVESPGVSAYLQSLLDDPENAVRLTALQWLAGRRGVVVDALTTALSDSDDVVHRAALEVLLSRGGSDQEIEAVRRAAEENEATLRERLTTFFAQKESNTPATSSQNE